MCLSIHVTVSFTDPARMKLPGEIFRSISPLVLSASGLYTGDREGSQSNGSRKSQGQIVFPMCPYCEEGTLAFSA